MRAACGFYICFRVAEFGRWEWLKFMVVYDVYGDEIAAATDYLASFIIFWSVNNCESRALLAIQNWPNILFVRGFFYYFHIKSIRSLNSSRSVSANIIKRIMDILWCHAEDWSGRKTSKWKLAISVSVCRMLACVVSTPLAASLWFHFIYLFICSRDFLYVVNFSLWPHSRQCSVHVAWVSALIAT